MGRAPCCDKANVKRGPWSPEEDAALKNYLEAYGNGGNWISLPCKAGLKRCGKSCRLRWLNYLRPNIKHGGFTEEEDNIICALYAKIGSRWSVIAAQLPGRTDNDVKNHWNTKLKKKLSSSKEHLMLTPKGAGTMHSFEPPVSLNTQHYSLSLSIPSPAGQYSSSDSSAGISDAYYLLNPDGQDFSSGGLVPPTVGSNFQEYCYGIQPQQEQTSVQEMIALQGGNYGYLGPFPSTDSIFGFSYDECMWVEERKPIEGCGVVSMYSHETKPF